MVPQRRKYEDAEETGRSVLLDGNTETVAWTAKKKRKERNKTRFIAADDGLGTLAGFGGYGGGEEEP